MGTHNSFGNLVMTRNHNGTVRKFFAQIIAINHLSFFTACGDVDLPLQQVITEIRGAKASPDKFSRPIGS